MRTVLASLVMIVCLAGFAEGGEIVVWGSGAWEFGGDDIDGNDFVAIACGHSNALGLRSDGSIVEWMIEPSCSFGCGTEATVIPDEFSQVDVGAWHNVALRVDGSLYAWGSCYVGRCDVPEGNDFIKISVGRAHSLALRADGTIEAWGFNFYGQCDVPEGVYVDIEAGSDHSLAVEPNGAVRAWGRNTDGQCNVPEVGLTGISSSSHNLALRADNSLVAWGYNGNGQCDVPEGNDFAAVAAGYYHSVALKQDGSLVAWGEDSNDRCNVPDGNGFVAIAAGDYLNLALTSNEKRILAVQAEPNGMVNLIPSEGTHSYYVGQPILLTAAQSTKCPDVYKFTHWSGDVADPNAQAQYITMDADKTVTAHYVADERKCGDECHPIQQGDLNGDCYTNFDDFAIYATTWLACTHPNCD
jgi:hypothetical protein